MMTNQKKEVAVAEPKAKVSLVQKLAAANNIEPTKYMACLKETVFKGATDEQLMALLMVSSQYGLNPLLKEIYAFPAKGGGIVPVVGVDGWINMINNHPQMDGMELTQTDEECTCSIYRKDRTHPTIVTEYLSECKRNTDPWKMEKRMLRHKAIIQCARVAFGFSGIKDPDEAERILESTEYEDITTPTTSKAKPVVSPSKLKEPAVEQLVPTAYDQLIEYAQKKGLTKSEVEEKAFAELSIEDLTVIKSEQLLSIIELYEGVANA
jgi:phage recombination protein Bet